MRPLLVLLSTEAAGGNWVNALPAAAAVELVHNFSLLHDDIEDNSSLRRGRPAVWVKWNLPQALNTGDTMLTLAHLTLLQIKDTHPTDVTLKAISLLQRTCLHLTQGQFLDIAYETRSDLSVEDYWPMVRGKTAALIGGATELGALIAEAGEDTCFAYRKFGLNLGLAFQVLDDFLGIWGDAALTGKSSASDLLQRKKTLPVLFALQKKRGFAERWNEGAISPQEVPEIAEQLKSDGAYDYTKREAERLTRGALEALEQAHPKGKAGEALVELADELLNRDL